MIRIAHLADIHIRNYKYHFEYKKVFEQLFDSLKQQKPDVICVAGDLVHSKNMMGPELIDLTSYFLRGLSSISPLRIILGNHDMLLKDKNRQDSISPIINALNNENIELWKYSGCYSFNESVDFNVMSVVDP